MPNSQDFLLYLFPIVISVPLSAGVAIRAWRRANVRGAATFAYLMINITLWSLLTLGLMLSRSDPTAWLWYKLRYLSIATVPAQWFLFGLQFTDPDRRLKNHWIWLLFLIPFLTQFILWVFPEFFILEATFRRAGFLMLIESDKVGPWFLVHYLYSMLCVVSGILTIILAGLHHGLIFRWQAVALLLGGLPLFFISAFLATVVRATYSLLTPVGFLIMGLVYSWALFRYKLLDLTSVSRNVIINSMSGGMVVLDQTYRIIDINQAAAALADRSSTAMIGLPFPAFFPQISSRIIGGALEVKNEFEMEIVRPGGGQGWYIVKKSEISNPRGEQKGLVLIIEDVSEKMAAQHALEQLNKNLESIVLQRTSALEQRTRQLEAVGHISAVLRQAETAERLLSVLMEEIILTLQAQGAVTLILKGEMLQMELARGIKIPIRKGVPVLKLTDLMQTMKTEGPQVIPPTLLAAFISPDQTPGLDEFEKLIAMPLLSSQNWMGVVLVFSRHPTDLSPSEYQTLEAVGAMAGNALNRINLHTRMMETAYSRRFKLAVLYEITTIANGHQPLSLTLEMILTHTLRIRGTQMGFITLLDADQSFRMASTQAHDQDALAPLLTQPALRLFCEDVLKFQKPLKCLAEAHPQISLSEGQILIGMPVVRLGVKFGVICIVLDGNQEPMDEDIELFSAIADHVGLAVENSQLRGQVEHAAVMIERQRLARELHDSVTQSLYGALLLGKAGRLYFLRQDYENALQKLNQVIEVSQQALKEMRLLIYEMRPLDLEGLGFRESVRQRLESVEKRADMQVIFECMASDELLEKIATTLYRIVQEGLSNVLKHSRATLVKVGVTHEAPAICLVIEDNGCGFDVNGVRTRGGLGLVSMHDRVGELGGEFLVSSTPGAGTRLEIRCPC